MVHVMTPKSRLFYDMEGQWRSRGGEYMDLTDVLLIDEEEEKKKKRKNVTDDVIISAYDNYNDEDDDDDDEGEYDFDDDGTIECREGDGSILVVNSMHAIMCGY